MTNFDNSDSINNIDMSINCDVLLVIRRGKQMEETRTYSLSFQQENFDGILEQNEGLENLNINILSATNYLILSFYKTGQKYTCSRTKIGKLLTILAFSYAVEKKLIFNEKVYKYGTCGTAINEILDRYERDIYITDPNNDDECAPRFTFDSIKKLDESIKKQYDFSGLDISVCRRIDDVFFRFATYSAFKLGCFINTIINQKNIIVNGTVSFYNLYKLSEENKKVNIIDDSNPLVDYLFKM